MNHRQAMRNLFKHTVRTAFTKELVDLAVQAVNGTDEGKGQRGKRPDL